MPPLSHASCHLQHLPPMHPSINSGKGQAVHDVIVKEEEITMEEDDSEAIVQSQFIMWSQDLPLFLVITNCWGVHIDDSHFL